MLVSRIHDYYFIIIENDFYYYYSRYNITTLRAPLYDIPLYARSLLRPFAAPLYDGKVVPLHSHSFAL